MTIEINFKPEDIEQFVKDSLLKSSIGKAIQDQVNRAIGGYSDAVGQAVSQLVKQMTIEIINEKYRDQIKTSIISVIEKKLTQELVDKTVMNVMEKLERNY